MSLCALLRRLQSLVFDPLWRIVLGETQIREATSLQRAGFDDLASEWRRERD